MPDSAALLRLLYDRFNARDIDGVLAMLHDDVLWANGWEGGHLSGRDAVRDYWQRQWASIDPHVEPLGFSGGVNAEVVVDIRQTVRDLSGKLISDRRVAHVFQIDAGRVRRFDIRKP